MKTINIPKLFHEFHGEHAILLNVVLVYLVGFLTAALSWFELVSKTIEVWKLLVVFLIFIDITGGIISNMTLATNLYYQKRPRLKKLFIVAHIIQPLLLSLIFVDYWSYMLFIYLLTMVSCIVLFNIHNTDIQRTVSQVFFILGLVGTIYFFDFEVLSVKAIGVLYMVKLILGFSVKKDG